MTNVESSVRIEIHTDGACLGNPGVGAWGAILRRLDNEQETKKVAMSGTASDTTNNRMELTAAIKAFGKLRTDETASVRVISDSKYVVDGMTKWLPKWLASSWLGAGRKPVKNRDLWEALMEASRGYTVQWKWVRAHNGDLLNEEVDSLANGAARKAAAELTHL